MYQNPIYTCISWCSKICQFLVKKCWCQQNPKNVSRDLYSFWVFLRKGITVPNFIIVGYLWQILGRGPKRPPHPWAALKKSILNRVNDQNPLSMTIFLSMFPTYTIDESRIHKNTWTHWILNTTTSKRNWEWLRQAEANSHQKGSTQNSLENTCARVSFSIKLQFSLCQVMLSSWLDDCF